MFDPACPTLGAPPTVPARTRKRGPVGAHHSQAGGFVPPAGFAEKGWLLRALVRFGHAYRRMLAIGFGLVGPEATYAITRLAAGALYRLLPPLRERSEAQCRAALGRRVSQDAVPRIAATSFVHRVWNLADLMLADRRLHCGTYHRFGGRIPTRWLARLQQAQQAGRPTIFLTGYYGPFDLWPIFLGFHGLRVGVVYRRHENAAFDAYRKRIRSRSGCELIPLERALGRLEAILSAGGMVALVADHPAPRRGVETTFLGLPTRVPRSVGLLACRHQADVVVAGIRRTGKAFHFELVIEDVIDHRRWATQDDPVRYVTERYLRALERIVLADPSQYLWAYPRWGNEMARTRAVEPGEGSPSTRNAGGAP